MSIPVTPDGPGSQGASTRPYLIRALHDWCTDNGFTPYLAVVVGAGVQVPIEFVKNGEIVLNASFEATSNMQLGNEFISFKARFGGVAREINVPVDHVIAIYARENGQGMAFPTPPAAAAAGGAAVPAPDAVVAAAAGDVLARGLRLATPPSDSSSPSDEVVAASEPPSPNPGGPKPPALKRVK